MQRRTFLTITLLSTVGSPARAAMRGGTLVYGRQTDCIYLDPVHTAQNADIWASLNLYDTLTQPTNDGRSVIPGLASSWETSQDGKVMTFKLRPNLKIRRWLTAHGRRREVVARTGGQQGNRW